MKLKARTATDKTPTERRDELVARKEAAYIAYSTETQHRQEAERTVGRLTKEIHERAYTTATGNGGTSDLDLEERLATAQADYERSLSRANSALTGTRALESEINQLMGDHFGAFAEEANAVTATARVAVEDFLASYRRAVAAWNDAVAAWSPLCTAGRIPGVPPFPVSDHALASLISCEAEARPPGVEILDTVPDSVLVD